MSSRQKVAREQIGSWIGLSFAIVRIRTVVAALRSNIDDCAIAYLDDRGHQTLHECYEFKGVEDDQVVFVKISDLIDAYNKVHGTDL